MLGRIFFITALLPIVTVAIAFRAANAQTPDVCTFVQTTPGELVPNSKIQATKLVSSGNVGGSSTQMTVSCRQKAGLSVSAPIQLVGPHFNPASAVVTVEAGFGHTNSHDGSVLPLPVGTTPLIVDFAVDKGSPLIPGIYKYGVKFTIVR